MLVDLDSVTLCGVIDVDIRLKHVVLDHYFDIICVQVLSFMIFTLLGKVWDVRGEIINEGNVDVFEFCFFHARKFRVFY